MLAPGAPASFAVWDVPGDLVVQTPDARIAAWSTDPRAGVPSCPTCPDVELPTCVLTLVAGGDRLRRDRSRCGRDQPEPPGSSTSTRSPSARRAALARQAGQPIVDLARSTRRSRSSGRRCGWPGCQGADPDGIPWVNRLLDAVRGDVGLEHGVALPVWDALVRGEADDLRRWRRRRPPARCGSGCPRAAT